MLRNAESPQGAESKAIEGEKRPGLTLQGPDLYQEQAWKPVCPISG